jgi:periplasmic copper chaperone A
MMTRAARTVTIGVSTAAVALLSLYGRAAAQTSTASSTDVVVRDAWVRESTGHRTSSAGYVTIENRGARDVMLTGVAVDGAQRVELHAMMHDNGQATMKSVGQVRIPAHGSVELAPGGLHAMIFDIAAPFERGKSVTMTLRFDDMKTRAVQAVVRPLSAMSAR